MSRAALERTNNTSQTMVPPPPPPPPQPQYMFTMQQAMQMQQPMIGYQQMMMPMAMPQFMQVPPEIPISEEEAEHISNVLPMHGSNSNYNINNLLYNNILENEYFRALYQLRTYHEVVDEIYRSVVHVEPWQTGTARFPSSAFCLMVKFMLMKLTLKQMNGLLNTSDSGLVRAIGFLYLRYTCPPSDLFKWFEPFLEDEEEFAPLSDKTVTMTMGAYVTKLLTDMQYYGTTLPRIPVPIERKMKVLLLLLNEKKTRRKTNLRPQNIGKFIAGTKVRAIYSDAENEPAWYEAVIESVESVEEEGQYKYWVKFPEYGNTELLDLGDMELLDGGDNDKKDTSLEEGEERRSDRRRSQSNDQNSRDSYSRGGRDDHRRRSPDNRDGDRRRDDGDRSSRRDGGGSRVSRSRSRDRGDDRRPVGGGGSKHGSTDNLLEKVLQSEREASAAVGRNYGHRPTSYKGSLSMQVDRYTTRQKSPPRDHRREAAATSGGGGGGRRRSPSPRRGAESSSHQGGGNSGGSSMHRSLEASMEAINRMKALKARYGDASAK